MKLKDVVKQNLGGRIIRFRGQKVLLVDRFLKRESFPGLYMGYVRRNDDNDDPATVESFVWVNNIGSILSEKPIPFDQKDNLADVSNYLELNSEEQELFAKVIYG